MSDNFQNSALSASRSWRYGLGIGLVAGLLDITLIYFVDPSLSPWLFIQAGIAWTLFGWIVLATDSGLPPMRHGILVTLLINVPWFINESILPGRWDHLPPLIVQGVVFGSLFGWEKRRMEGQGSINKTE
jgi:hypothetical protein